MRRVIVTGATGFIGKTLISKLIAKGVNVVALSRSFDKFSLPESELLTKIQVELDNLEELQNAIPCNVYDVFYHFAWAGVNGPTKADPITQLNNAKMALNCATIAKNIGCKKFLCAGTIAEKSVCSLSSLEKTNGGMMYGVAKYATHLVLETYCKNIGLAFVWMQFSNIYGPSNKTGNLVSYTIEQLKNDKEAIFGPALQPYDFIFADDLIEAVVRLGGSVTRRNCYFIGSGEPRVLKEYLLEIGKEYKKENLIKIGERPDDGIKYSFEMFNTGALVEDIGNYRIKTFTEGIKYTIEHYQ